MKRYGLLLVAIGWSVSAFAQSKPAPVPRQVPASLTTAYSSGLSSTDAAHGAGAYSTGFEPPTFLVGDITGQDGWFANFGNWTVSAANPALGVQHMHGTSDGFGPGSFALTADQPSGVLAFSIASADIFMSPTAPIDTWEFIPQDSVAMLVNTRVRFNADGTIDALVGPSPGAFVPTGDNWPAGYFLISVAVERATNNFEICLNGLSIFTGAGFAANILNVAFTGDMATPAHTWDVDNLELIDSPIGGCIAGLPNIALSSFSSTDSCATGAGDNNSVWEPGETINIPVTLVSNSAFTGVTGTLTSATPGVTILDGSATWPNLAAGVPTQSDAPHFTIEIAESFTCHDTIDLDLSVSANEGGPFALSLSEPVGALPAPTGLPLVIPDNVPAGVSSTLTINEILIIGDANVRVQINHTWVGDLAITIDPPGAAPPITLLDQPGVPASMFGCPDDNMDVTFDDAAVVDPETTCPATTPWLTGPVLPFAALSAVNGTDAQGVWTLTVSDNAGFDTGTVIDWELILTPAIVGQCEVCVGPVDADLALTKIATPPSVPEGTDVVFTLTATNNGPGPATGVVVTDTLPPELVYVSNDCGAVFANPTLTWTIGALAASASVVCNVTVNAPTAGSYSNNATIAGNENDPVAGNNAAAAVVTVQGGASVLEIPTLSRLGLALLALVIAAAAFVVMRRA